MLTDVEIAKIQDKINKLKRLSENNSNENEVNSALNKIVELENKLRYSEDARLDELNKQTLHHFELLAKRLLWQSARLTEAIEYCKRNETIEGLSDMVAMTFNAAQHTPQYGGGGGLPPGKYKGVIVNTYPEDTKDNFGNVKGGYLAFELTPIEGPLAGTKQTDRLNLQHAKPDVVAIANKQLSAYCHVLNKFQFQDTQELCNIPFLFEIKLQKEPNPNGYTEVAGIFDINGNEPGKAGSGQQPNQNAQGGQNNGGQPNIPPAGDVQAQGNQGGGQWGQNAGNQNAGNTQVDNNVQMPNQGGQQQDPNQNPQGGGQWGGQQGGGQAQQPDNSQGGQQGGGWSQGGDAGANQAGGASPGWGNRQ